MKLERLFEVKNSKLFSVDGKEKSVSPELVKAVKWSDVEGECEAYNEDFLAKLRDELKSLEEKNQFVFVEPVFDKDAPVEQFVAAMKHTARRIKDCASVIGFAIPQQVEGEKDFYISELSQKHAHYCFFSKNISDSEICMY